MNKKSKVFLRLLLVFATAIMLCSFFVACNPKDDGEKVDLDINPLLDLTEEVTLSFINSSASWPEMDAVFIKFEKKYPNVTMRYECIETPYKDNLTTRLENNTNVDIFRTSNIKDRESSFYDYALNLISEESKKYLDLSEANEGLVKNFKFTEAENEQYAVPYAGEMRGMYVNKTLLAKHNLEVPKTYDEFMECCRVLKAAGLIPIQGSTSFAQQFIYPYICNKIVNGGNYAADYAAIENIDDDISEYFRDAYEIVYEIMDKKYFDFEGVEQTYGYTFNGSTGTARDFLNVTEKTTENGNEYSKNDDIGNIAFLTNTQAFGENLAKAKADYHSNIEYEFMLSPVDEGGGYAYLSPADGLAINKNSAHVDWALEFLDFFFKDEINTEYATADSKIPNTKDAALGFVSDATRSCTVGEVTFGYAFYATVTTILGDGYDSKTTDDYTGVGDMVGMCRMTSQKNAVDYAAVDDAYIAAHPTEQLYYRGKVEKTISKKVVLVDSYLRADAAYIAANPTATLYRVSHTGVRYTVDDYIARLETEFQKIKATRTAG